MSAAFDSLSLVSDDRVDELLPSTEELIDDIEKALGRFSQDTNSSSSSHQKQAVIQPLRTQIHSPKHQSVLFTMPCYLSDEDIYSVKIICYGIGTADGGGDVTTGGHDDARRDVTVLVNLYNGKSGVPLIMMEGESLSMKRTAAASAVATKYLVNGEPTILTIMGSGRLARSHFQALHALFRFKEVRVWNRSEVSGLKFVNELKCENVNAKWCSEAESAVSNADVICLVTASRTPVLNLTWVQPGAHINAVGACQPTAQEMDAVSMGEAVIYVDSREAANAESGDIILSGVEIYAEIGEVINGTKEAFRQRKTVFKSLGIAVEDAVTAYKVYKNLRNKN